VGNLPDELRKPAAQYLRSAMAIAFSPGIVSDIFDASKGHVGDPSRLTDGTWEWPEYLAYYVAEYGVELPEEFITTMRSNGWTAPQLSQEELIALIDESRTYG
jgi:hypothetical protein